MSPHQWTETQIRRLINERKQQNATYHGLPKGQKTVFWADVATKINQQENCNINGDQCNKKFLLLTRAYYVSKQI